MSYYITLKNSKSKPKSNRVIKIQKKIQIMYLILVYSFFLYKKNYNLSSYKLQYTYMYEGTYLPKGIIKIQKKITN